jgi:hypothetical protein
VVIWKMFKSELTLTGFVACAKDGETSHEKGRGNRYIERDRLIL